MRLLSFAFASACNYRRQTDAETIDFFRLRYYNCLAIPKTVHIVKATFAVCRLSLLKKNCFNRVAQVLQTKSLITFKKVYL